MTIYTSCRSFLNDGYLEIKSWFLIQTFISLSWTCCSLRIRLKVWYVDSFNFIIFQSNVNFLRDVWWCILIDLIKAYFWANWDLSCFLKDYQCRIPGCILRDWIRLFWFSVNVQCSFNPKWSVSTLVSSLSRFVWFSFQSIVKCVWVNLERHTQ